MKLFIIGILLFGSMSLNLDICEGYRILCLFPMPARSHYKMHEALMKGLARKGHQVDVVSPFPLEKPYPNYTDIIDLSSSAPGLVNNLTYSHVALWSNLMINTIANTFGNDLCHLMQQPKFQELIKNPPNDPPYDLVITEVLAAHCYMAFGHHLKVPTIGVSTAVLYPWHNRIIANPANLAFVPNNFINYAAPMNFWQRLHNTALTVLEVVWFEYMTSYQDEIIRKYLGDGAPGVREAERSLALVLANSHPALNGARPVTSALIEVGGLHVQDEDVEIDQKIRKWMDNSKAGFVYFTFGSMINIESFPTETVEAFYRSLEKIAPIRVLIKIPEPDKLPPGMPKNFLTFSWIAQNKVLKHKNIKAFITHGGLMGIQEAIYAGVPMIAIPLFADQYTNAYVCASKKISVLLDFNDITEEAMDEALNAILYNPVYKNAMLDMSTKFNDRPMTPMDTATWWVEWVVRHKGSLRSPALDLTWWRIQLLDVYAALLLITACIIFITIIIIKCLANYVKKMLFTTKSVKVTPARKMK